ncbi:hypothetical protein N9Y42_03000 [Mariniblastus sp.]|nr:hypothetical protein [Mariniblastus sp.]
MIIRLNWIASALLAFAAFFGGYAKPELQRPIVGYQKPVSSRVFENSEFTEKSIGKFERLDLRLKWAIVSGDLNSSNDRIRVRLRCNDEQWIDLYGRRNSTGQFDRNVVSLRAFGNEDAQLLPDLRIVGWSHERLWVKFAKVESKMDDKRASGDQLELKKTKPSDSYFEFDLTK